MLTRFSSLATRRRGLWPAAFVVVLAIGAYWFTLSSLADYLRLDTPLAYLLLLPIFSAMVAAATVLRAKGRPSAPRELHIDLLIGIPLIVVALLLVAVLPAVWSTYYWSERPDVVSLALFVTGGIVLGYGVTWAWRLRSALVFLVLMWPAIYLHLVAGPMQSLTDGTYAALSAVARLLPIGVTTAPGNIVNVASVHGTTVSVALSSACSGANGIIGVVLVGAALALTMNGAGWRRALWVMNGIVIVFLFNVARIVSILWLAHTGHADLALGGYHATIGLVLFVLTLAIMLAIAPLFGLRSVFLDPRLARLRPAPLPRLRGVSRVATACGLAIAAVVALGAERDLGVYAAFVDGTGAPTVRAYQISDALPRGWTTSYFATYDWAQQYFGQGSRFDRYVLQYGRDDSTQAFMDVVRTDDQGSLDAYNIQSCFLFHNYDLRDTERIDVGNGVTALLVNYSDPSTQDRWATVSWAWPVVWEGHSSYERITLTADLSRDGGGRAPDPRPATGFRGTVLGLLNGLGGPGGPQDNADWQGADHALRGVAATLVTSTLKNSR